MIFELSPMAGHLHLVSSLTDQYELRHKYSLEQFCNILFALYFSSEKTIVVRDIQWRLRAFGLTSNFKPSTYVYCLGEEIPECYASDLEVEKMEFSVYCLWYESLQFHITERPTVYREVDNYTDCLNDSFSRMSNVTHAEIEEFISESLTLFSNNDL